MFRLMSVTFLQSLAGVEHTGKPKVHIKTNKGHGFMSQHTGTHNMKDA